MYGVDLSLLSAEDKKSCSDDFSGDQEGCVACCEKLFRRPWACGSASNCANAFAKRQQQCIEKCNTNVFAFLQYVNMYGEEDFAETDAWTTDKPQKGSDNGANNSKQKEADNAAKKAQKEADKAAKNAQREADKAARDAQKEANKAKKNAQTEAEKAAKIAQKEAEKAEKEAERAEAAAEKAAKKAGKYPPQDVAAE